MGNICSSGQNSARSDTPRPGSLCGALCAVTPAALPSALPPPPPMPLYPRTPSAPPPPPAHGAIGTARPGLAAWKSASPRGGGHRGFPATHRVPAGTRRAGGGIPASYCIPPGSCSIPAASLPASSRRGAGEGSEQGRGGGGKRREKKKKNRNPTPDHRCRREPGGAQLPLEAPCRTRAWERGCGAARRGSRAWDARGCPRDRGPPGCATGGTPLCRACTGEGRATHLCIPILRVPESRPASSWGVLSCFGLGRLQLLRAVGFPSARHPREGKVPSWSHWTISSGEHPRGAAR